MVGWKHFKIMNESLTTQKNKNCIYWEIDFSFVSENCVTIWTKIGNGSFLEVGGRGRYLHFGNVEKPVRSFFTLLTE